MHNLPTPQLKLSSHLLPTGLKWTFRLGFLCLLFFYAFRGISQNYNLISFRQITLQSKILNQHRNILVFLPLDYDKTKKYPVVYMLDGNQHTLYTGAAFEELAGAGVVPQMIVVGIPNIDRTKDLTPTHKSNMNGQNDPSLQTSGGGDQFLDFITNELFHYIDSAYSTMSYRIFIGHSLGGLLVTHSLFSSRNKFNGYISIDPTLAWDNKYVVNNAAQTAQSFYNKIYVASAMDPTLPVELGNNGIEINALKKILDAKHYNGLFYKFENFKDESHATVPVPSIVNGIKYLYDGFAFPNDFKDSSTTNLSVVLDHYSKFSKQQGANFLPPENLINDLGYYFLNEYKDYNKAISIFLLNTKNFSASYNTYDSLGEAYLNNGDNGNALKNYQKALMLNPQSENAKKMVKKLEQRPHSQE